MSSISTKDQTYYTNNKYDPSISNTHRWRTVENCSEFMIPFIKPTDKILDVGCGPGTITTSLAKYVPQGQVYGIEPTEGLFQEAKDLLHQQEQSSKHINNVKFELGSAFKLPYEDNSFSIVHAHQVLIHLSDPIKALQEMIRVIKPNGLICVKDCELNSTIIYPYSEPLEYFMKEIMSSVNTKRNAASLHKQWIYEANEKYRTTETTTTKTSLELVQHSAISWCNSTTEQRKSTADMFIKRCLQSENFIKDTKFTKNQIVEAWENWSKDETGVNFSIHGEVVIRKIEH
ncbi:hypothetical protein WICPIJ_002340 [Wickerhamomyces pijperi]|uniref:Methyltransferase domain-containing protein n=1 Tax=Wickerhamomyces pijperi TaxID=599730 RepID=A0A9P8QA19_WICPI|nr:hypothetical protein WICPIJ_002340 [Wickerhamomyces pijperi]